VRKAASRLQQEIKQNRPFSSTKQEAVLGVLKTADVLRREISRVVAEGGLTLQQYNVLRILRGAKPDGLPTLEIAERLIEESPGITRFMDRLESMNFIERERCSKDRRRVLCRITKKGLEVLKQLDDPIEAWTKASLAMLDAAELRSLIKTLDQIRQNV
jgi:DNA-binding MarR family transcriptional regulator